MSIKVDLKILALVPEYDHVTLGVFLGGKLSGVTATKGSDLK